jgi:hypothetical protein
LTPPNSGADALSTTIIEDPENPSSTNTVENQTQRPTRPEDPDAELSEQLEHRAKSFSEAVLSGDEDGAILFVDPYSRDNAGLQMSLGYLVDKVSALGNSVRVQRRVRMRDGSAKVIFSFTKDARTEPIMLALQWVLIDGGWYVKPDSRDAGDSPESSESGTDRSGL